MEYETHTPKISILHTTLNSSESVHRIMSNLAGIELQEDPETGDIKYIKKGRAIVSEIGLNDIFLFMEAIDKESKLSVLSSEDVNSMMQELINSLVITYTAKREAWKLHPDDDLMISHLICRSAFLSLNRSLGGKELDHAYINSTRSESIQKQEQRATYTDNAKKSLFSKDTSTEEVRS